MQYNEKMAAQIAAFFTFRQGGAIEILKLMKLMYLAERESFKRYGEPLTGDSLYSMDNGPNVSKTYDTCKNKIVSEYWRTWMRDRDGNLLSLIENKDPTDRLSELSIADLEILDSIWGKFGGMTAGQLVDYTHTNCPEWKDPKGSSIFMPYKELLSILGYEDSVISELEERITEQKNIDNYFKIAL